MEFIGIIPARYASTRLPGKPLEGIEGKSMIERAYAQAKKGLDVVIVATDDQRIFDHVKSFNGEVVMTNPDHLNGTSRCLEAFEIWKQEKNLSKTPVIINIQGDEPLLEPQSLTELKNCFNNEAVEFATLAIQVNDYRTLKSDSNVYVTFDNQNNACYFSRSVIPFVRNYPLEDWPEKAKIYKHIGLYAYTYPTLEKFAGMPPGRLEQAESLEQLRWIEQGGKLQVAITEHPCISVDTPEDLAKVREIVRKREL